MKLDESNNHDIWVRLKAQDAEAWTLVWHKAVLTETRSLRSAEMARKWGVSPEELLSRLYEEMIGKGRIDLYRDDGASVICWLRRYVRGYILKADPSARGMVSLEGMAEEDGEEGKSWEEKLAKKMSDASGASAYTLEDLALRRKEEWQEVQRCFATMWKDSPLKAYVHLLKLRLNLSSRQIKDMLGISSEANVDQLFSRAVKDMRELRDAQ